MTSDELIQAGKSRCGIARGAVVPLPQLALSLGAALWGVLIGTRESERPIRGVLGATLLGVELHPGRHAERAASKWLGHP